MKQNNTGFILLEVLTALVILTLGILVIIRSLSVVIKSNRLIQNHTLAVIISDNIFNRIEAKEKIIPPEKVSLLGKNFNIEQDITAINDLFKKYSLKTTWEEAGKNNTINFSTTIIDPEHRL
ncbi:MAG: hypothetical protein GY853_07535 [PVC group bacterium]|nr:hypothetical protein [PVC group bacterium]